MESIDVRVVIALIFTIFAWFLQSKWRLYKKMAPGPFGLPVVGSLYHLSNTNPITEFQKYKKKYGKVFSLSVGNFYVTVVTDWKDIINSLKKEEFQGRPHFEIWKIRNENKINRGIGFSEGTVWNEQRRFVMRNLRDFGFGKASMEGMLVQELQDLQSILRKDLGHPVSLKGVFNASVLNSLWFIATGKRFELRDPTFAELKNLLIDNIRAVQIISPNLFFFTLVKYGLFANSYYKSISMYLKKVKSMIGSVVEEHWNTSVEGEVNDFVDAYIKEIKETSNPESSFYADEGKANLLTVLLDLFNAGGETTSTTLQWVILYVCHYPEVQKKLQSEIDNVVGRSRPPTREDKPKLVYLEAVLNEVHRSCSLVPFGVYHKALVDGEIGEYFIPKDSIVFFSIYDAHHDPEVWKDPENFRPERFLDATGTKVVKHDALMPFSSGKRVCLGEALARDSLFFFVTGLLQQFTFAIDPNCGANDKNDLRGNPGGFVQSPKPYKVIITERK